MPLRFSVPKGTLGFEKFSGALVQKTSSTDESPQPIGLQQDQRSSILVQGWMSMLVCTLMVHIATILSSGIFLLPLNLLRSLFHPDEEAVAHARELQAIRLDRRAIEARLHKARETRLDLAETTALRLVEIWPRNEMQWLMQQLEVAGLISGGSTLRLGRRRARELATLVENILAER